MRDIWMNDDFAAEVADKIRKESADLLVVDCMLVGVLANSKSFQVPTAVLVHSLFKSVLQVRDSMVLMGNKLRMAAERKPFDAQAASWENKDLRSRKLPSLPRRHRRLEQNSARAVFC